VTDPTRMSRSDDTPDGLRELLATAAGPKPLSAEDRAKILAGAAAIVAGTAATTTAAAASAGAAQSTVFSAGFFVKVVGVAAVVVSVGLGARSVTQRAARDVASAPVASTRVAPQITRAPSIATRSTPPTSESPRIEPAPSESPRIEAPRVEAPARLVASAVSPPQRATGASTTARVAQGPRDEEPVTARTTPGCPLERGPGGLAVESRILATATAALSSNPAVAAACVRALDAASTSDALRDELLFVGFDAARRLGRDAEARRYAEALVARAPSSSYATRAQRWLDER